MEGALFCIACLEVLFHEEFGGAGGGAAQVEAGSGRLRYAAPVKGVVFGL